MPLPSCWPGKDEADVTFIVTHHYTLYNCHILIALLASVLAIQGCLIPSHFIFYCSDNAYRVCSQFIGTLRHYQDPPFLVLVKMPNHVNFISVGNDFILFIFKLIQLILYIFYPCWSSCSVIFYPFVPVCLLSQLKQQMFTPVLEKNVKKFLSSK